jgi:hypothetical protein
MSALVYFTSEESAKLAYEQLKHASENGPLRKEDMSSIGCTTASDYENWAKEENKSTEELEKQFESLYPVNSISLDPYYDRTSSEAMRLLLEICLKEKDSIYRMKNCRIVFERAEGDFDEKKHLLPLEELNDMRFIPTKNEKPTKQYPKTGSAVFVAKDRNHQHLVHFLFGNVDEITFMKTDEFVDSDDNPDYVDENGDKYALIPLMPLGSGQNAFINKLRCSLQWYTSVSFLCFFAACYKSAFEPEYDEALLKDSSKWGITDEDCIYLIKHLVQFLDEKHDLSLIKVQKCKRDGHVCIEYPSHYLMMSNLKSSFEFALSCLKYRDRRFAFLKKGASMKDLLDKV